MSGRSSFMDGVPFAINPIFMPAHTDKAVRQKIDDAQEILESDLTQAMTLIKCKYQFRNEMSVLELNVDNGGKKLLKKEKKIRTKSKIIENGLKPDINGLAASEASVSIKTNSVEYSKASCLNPMPVNSNYSNILLEPTRQSTLNPPITNSSSNHHSSHLAQTNDMFNPNLPQDILDPFNDMELKTINELEELKTILHNHQIDQAAKTLENNNLVLVRNRPVCNNQFELDNFGLPKVSFIDLDINSNKLA